MRRHTVQRLAAGVLPVAAMAGILLLHAQGGGALRKAQLLVALPEYATTPDSMVEASGGDLVVACPNFASYPNGATKPTVPACFIRVGKDRKVRKWFDCPVLAETGRACPMGIDFGPGGELYVADNQNWAAGNGADGLVNQGRILRLKIQGDRLVETVVVAKGISHPNGLKYRNGALYVTVSMLPKVKRADGFTTSAVYRFPADAHDIQVHNTLEDPNLLASFVTENRFAAYGLDGLVFDSKGNLFLGNFGDGKLHKLTFDAKGKISGNTILVRTDHDISLDPKLPAFLPEATHSHMRTTDGMCVDSQDNIYVADFSNNAIAKVTPAGVISVLAQDGDVGGRDGALNEPGEPIVWNGRLVASNFDMVFAPDKVVTKHTSPATLSVIDLK